MTPEKAYNKCLKENKRIFELEDIIVEDYYYSYLYALDIIKGSWEKGEETISKVPLYSYRYALNVIRGPFEKCHHIIFNSDWKYKYADYLKSIDYDMSKISEWLL